MFSLCTDTKGGYLGPSFMRLLSRQFCLANLLAKQELTAVPVTAMVTVWCSINAKQKFVVLSKFFWLTGFMKLGHVCHFVVCHFGSQNAFI